MSTYQQQQQSDQEKKRTWFSRKNVVIATIVIVALLITTAWILSILNVIPATWATIITAVLTVATAVFTLVAAFPSLFGSEKPEQHTTHSSTSPGFHHPRIPGLSSRERKRSRRFMRNSPRTIRPLLCLPASAARENPRLPPLSLSTRKNSASMAKDPSWLKRSGCASMPLPRSA